MSDFKVNIVTDASTTVAGAKQATDGLDKLAAAAGKTSTGMKETGKAAEEVKSGILDGLSPAMAHYGTQAEAATVKTERLTSAKSQLKSMAKGLASQIPGLGAVMGLALNPLALVVAAIAGSFALWNRRVAELQSTLAGFELPDIKSDRIERINQEAEAWRSYQKAIEGAAAAYNGVEAAAGRVIKKLDEEGKEKQKLLAAQKALDLAKLETQKGSMTAVEYAQARAGIENRYGGAESKLERDTEQRKMAEKARMAGNLVIESERKRREAAGIQIGSAEDDAETKQQLREQADMAKKDQEARRQRLGRLVDMKDSFGARVKGTPWFTMKYGSAYTNTEAQGVEREGIERDQDIIDRYNEFRGRMPGRNEERARRSGLERDAASGFGRAYTADREVGEEFGAFQRRDANNSAVEGLQNEARAWKAIAEGKENQASLNREAAEQIERSGAVGSLIIEGLRRQGAILDQMAEELQRQRGQIGGQR
jgi:hypothetical protein